MSVWVLTSEVNEYDQCGQYFEHAWPYKPTREEILEMLPGESANDVDWIYSGGGRTSRSEYKWFHFYEVQ